MKKNGLIILLIAIILGLTINTSKVVIGVDKKEYKASAEAEALGFKSESLYSCVLNSFDEEATVTKADLANVEYLYCVGEKIEDTTGIEQLTGLQSINLGENKITSIDLSKNTNLVSVSLYDNKLSSIKLPETNNIEYLDLQKNNLSSIDLSKLTSLKRLSIANNNLSSLDVSKNNSLQMLYAASNNLSSINLDNNIQINMLDLYNNSISSIDLSKLTALNYLNLSLNNLKDIDLSKNINLTELYISSNNLDKLDLSKQDNLLMLNAVFNHFKGYDVNHKEKIHYLAVDYDWLNSFDFNDYSSLELLDVNYHGIISVDGTQIKRDEILKRLPEDVKVEDVGVFSSDNYLNPACSRGYVSSPSAQVFNMLSANAAAMPTTNFMESSMVFDDNIGYSDICKSQILNNSVISEDDSDKIEVRSLNFRVDGVDDDVQVRFTAYYDINFMQTGVDNNGDTILTNVPNTVATIASIIVFGIMILGIGICIVLRSIQNKEVRND